MASGDQLFCDPCSRDDTVSSGYSRCSDCEKILCAPCDNAHRINWHALTEEEQNNAKRFLEENYTVVELKETFDIFYAKRGKRPKMSQFRKFILRQPGMPRKRNSLDEMNKKMEEKVDEAADLRMKLDINERELSSSKRMIDQQKYFVQKFANLDYTLLKKCEDNDKLKDQYLKLLESYNHMKKTYSPVVRDSRIILSQLIGKDESIKSLSKQNNEKDESIKSLSKQNNEKDESIKSLSKQNNEKDESIKSLSKQNNEKDESIKSLSKQNKKLNELKVKQNIELEDMDRKLKKQMLIYDELKWDTNNRLEILEKELMTKNCEINSIKSNQKEEHLEMKQLQAQVAELKEMLNSRNAVAENGWSACTIL